MYIAPKNLVNKISKKIICPDDWIEMYKDKSVLSSQIKHFEDVFDESIDNKGIVSIETAVGYTISAGILKASRTKIIRNSWILFLRKIEKIGDFKYKYIIKRDRLKDYSKNEYHNTKKKPKIPKKKNK